MYKPSKAHRFEEKIFKLSKSERSIIQNAKSSKTEDMTLKTVISKFELIRVSNSESSWKVKIEHYSSRGFQSEFRYSYGSIISSDGNKLEWKNMSVSRNNGMPTIPKIKVAFRDWWNYKEKKKNGITGIVNSVNSLFLISKERRDKIMKNEKTIFEFVIMEILRMKGITSYNKYTYVRGVK